MVKLFLVSLQIERIVTLKKTIKQKLVLNISSQWQWNTSAQVSNFHITMATTKQLMLDYYQILKNHHGNTETFKSWQLLIFQR